MLKRIPLVLVLAFTFACSESAIEPTEQSADEVSTTPLFNTSGVVEKVTGSGHFDDFRFPDPALRTFSFVAIEKADGSVGGNWELTNRNADVRIHGVIECVSLNLNEAWFAGTTTLSDIGGEVGFIRAFRVVDNGEGSGAVPDEVSFSPPVGNAQDWCDGQLPQPTFPIEAGNVQIHHDQGFQFTDVPFGGIRNTLTDGQVLDRCLSTFADGQGPKDFLRTNKDGTTMVHVSDQEGDLTWVRFSPVFSVYQGIGKWSLRSGWSGINLLAPLAWKVTGRVTNLTDPYDTQRLTCVFDSEEGTNYIRLGREQVGNSD
jgi:hypothetical protein